MSVRTTLGQPYRRVLLQRRAAEGQTTSDSSDFRLPTTNDGKGVCFISHLGQVQPSGFLPTSAGNVRTHHIVDIYRNAPLFQKLRDTSLLKGKCGICPFNQVYGGCRARAYALTGDYLAANPTCIFDPTQAHLAEMPTASQCLVCENPSGYISPRRILRYHVTLRACEIIGFGTLGRPEIVSGGHRQEARKGISSQALSAAKSFLVGSSWACELHRTTGRLRARRASVAGWLFLGVWIIVRPP